MEEKKTNPEDLEVGLDLTENLNDNSDSVHLKLEETEKQLSEMDGKYKLLYADFENYKKRVIKEKEDIKSNTKVSMLSAVLDMDNDIMLAIKNIKDPSAKEGVSLIAGKLDTFLKGQGIETIQTETYDEDLHEVVTVIGEGKNVIDVISKGYTLSGKPFRYPKIVLG
jgi:molecular chaperone GrpE